VSVTRDGASASLRVEDTGVGIDAEHLPHVFERFYRADPSRARGDAGAGLGLAICRWIAQAHSGEISVDSTPGQGSVFTVRLPVIRGAADARPQRPPTVASH
jgi:signal transduction histidine kinase